MYHDHIHTLFSPSTPPRFLQLISLLKLKSFFFTTFNLFQKFIKVTFYWTFNIRGELVTKWKNNGD